MELSPAATLTFVLAIAVFAAIKMVLNLRRDRRQADILERGTPVDGEIISVRRRPQSQAQRERSELHGTPPVRMKLRYTDPATQAETTVEYRALPNLLTMPSSITGVTAFNDAQEIRRRFAESLAHKRRLLDEGATPAEATELTAQMVAEKWPDPDTLSSDADGFTSIDPVPVNVHVSATGDIIVVF